ncbi:unnamed protein product [Wuchereria bancrofti]|uniref:Uncharacterized protein n=1 Tax=Wuchereria bancrofti TaxID=6293 RepID=A0A3P7DP12_WUCBA|nr:unnamed protein product [Wuchereria bancrofti]
MFNHKDEINRLPREIECYNCRCNSITLSLSCSALNNSSLTQWETENLLPPAFSSTKISDQFLLDDKTQRTYTSNINIRSLIPINNSTSLMSSNDKGTIKRQQANFVQLLAAQEFTLLRNKLRNEQNSKISIKLHKNHPKIMDEKFVKEKLANHNNKLVKNELN